MISIKDLPGVAVSCAAAKLLLLVLLISVTVVVGAQEQTSEKMPFAGLVGEYRGTLKRTKMVVWATPVAAPGLGGAVTALMFFPEAERQALVDRLPTSTVYSANSLISLRTSLALGTTNVGFQGVYSALDEQVIRVRKACLNASVPSRHRVFWRCH